MAGQGIHPLREAYTCPFLWRYVLYSLPVRLPRPLLHKCHQLSGHNWALLGSRRPSIERCMGGCMNPEIEASFFKLREDPEGLCDGRPPSDSAQVDSRPNFTSSVTWRNQ